jgi:hypothetical protein
VKRYHRRIYMRHSIVTSHRSWFMLLVLAAVALATLACGFEGGAFGSTPTPSGAGGASARAVGGSAPGAALDLTQGPEEAILITVPQPGQGASGSLQVEGLSDPALARQLNVLVRDAQGAVIGAARPVVQDRAGQRSAFSVNLFLPPDVPRQTGQAQVYAISPGNNGVTHLASVEVELGGGGRAAAAPIDPQAREAILIASPSPDAAVKDVVKVAAATRLGPRIVVEVRDANNQIVGRAEPTVVQTAGAPAQILADVPIQVSAAGPGRVLVYAVNARSGSTEHLNSVEVNLVP